MDSIAVDSGRQQQQQQQQQHSLNHLAYSYATPQFINPWRNQSGGIESQVQAQVQQAQAQAQAQAQLQQQQRTLPLPPLSSFQPILPLPTTATSTALAQPSNLLAQPPFQLQFPQQFCNAPSADFATMSAPGYITLPDSRATAFTFGQNDSRRPSLPYDLRREDMIEASNQIIALNPNDITPTPRMYAAANSNNALNNNSSNDLSNRSTPESYGFPSNNSPRSSVSSASGAPSFGSSVGDYSLTDYSSAGESVDLNYPPSLHRSSNGLHGSLPPQSMMNQFSSKIGSLSSKKHKCKICDKRFTRPSSLQTHIYSHTGEKPFVCKVDGCGRKFSVVSNLRRHKKVHRDDDTSSIDESADDES